MPTLPVPRLTLFGSCSQASLGTGYFDTLHPHAQPSSRRIESIIVVFPSEIRKSLRQQLPPGERS
jgi:hypothetical protein